MPSVNPYLRQNEETVILRDYKHASRLYIDNAYRLMPKASWLYYVVFDISSNAVKDLIFGGRRKHTEIGMLVKQVDLPKFQINTETLNQYNRKIIIQKNIEFQPVSFTFHDDINNTVNDMWINYFRYYYNDDLKKDANLSDALNNLAAGAINNLIGSTIGGILGNALNLQKDNEISRYANTKYKTADVFDPFAYGLNTKDKSSKKTPFFKSITIYQLNRQDFTSYKLINPMIKNWDHDRLDQTQGSKLAESRMTMEYEAVLYGKGAVSKDNPSGFAVFHYDNTPSPLGVGNRGLRSIFRDALRGTADIFGDILGNANLSNNAFFDALGAVGAVGATALSGFGGALEIRPKTNTGYSTLDRIGAPIQNTTNGLGFDMQLNIGSNIRTAGGAIASPISLVTAPFIAPDATRDVFFGDGVITRPTSVGSIPPDSSSPELISESMNQTLDLLNEKVLSSQIYRASEDVTPAGSTPAPGRYFTMPAPLADTNVYTAANINENSSITQIKAAITNLNTAWSNDNDFVASQIVSQDIIDQKLSLATSSVEFDTIKNEASSVILALKSLQTQVDGKYQGEFDRLNNLLATKQNKISGNLNVT